MNSTQPPYLHQNEPLVRLLPLVQADNFSRTQGFNLWTCLLLVTLGLLGHSLSQLLTGLAFAGVWTYGIYTPDAKQHRFYLVIFLLAAATPFIIGFHAIHQRRRGEQKRAAVAKHQQPASACVGISFCSR